MMIKKCLIALAASPSVMGVKMNAGSEAYFRSFYFQKNDVHELGSIDAISPRNPTVVGYAAPLVDGEIPKQQNMDGPVGVGSKSDWSVANVNQKVYNKLIEKEKKAMRDSEASTGTIWPKNYISAMVQAMINTMTRFENGANQGVYMLKENWNLSVVDRAISIIRNIVINVKPEDLNALLKHAPKLDGIEKNKQISEVSADDSYATHFELIGIASLLMAMKIEGENPYSLECKKKVLNEDQGYFITQKNRNPVLWYIGIMYFNNREATPGQEETHAIQEAREEDLTNRVAKTMMTYSKWVFTNVGFNCYAMPGVLETITSFSLTSDDYDSTTFETAEKLAWASTTFETAQKLAWSVLTTGMKKHSDLILVRPLLMAAMALHLAHPDLPIETLIRGVSPIADLVFPIADPKERLGLILNALDKNNSKDQKVAFFTEFTAALLKIGKWQDADNLQKNLKDLQKNQEQLHIKDMAFKLLKKRMNKQCIFTLLNNEQWSEADNLIEDLKKNGQIEDAEFEGFNKQRVASKQIATLLNNEQWSEADNLIEDLKKNGQIEEATFIYFKSKINKQRVASKQENCGDLNTIQNLLNKKQWSEADELLEELKKNKHIEEDTLNTFKNEINPHLETHEQAPKAVQKVQNRNPKAAGAGAKLKAPAKMKATKAKGDSQKETNEQASKAVQKVQNRNPKAAGAGAKLKAPAKMKATKAENDAPASKGGRAQAKSDNVSSQKVQWSSPGAKRTRKADIKMENKLKGAETKL